MRTQVISTDCPSATALGPNKQRSPTRPAVVLLFAAVLLGVAACSTEPVVDEPVVRDEPEVNAIFPSSPHTRLQRPTSSDSAHASHSTEAARAQSSGAGSSANTGWLVPERTTSAPASGAIPTQHDSAQAAAATNALSDTQSSRPTSGADVSQATPPPHELAHPSDAAAPPTALPPGEAVSGSNSPPPRVAETTAKTEHREVLGIVESLIDVEEVDLPKGWDSPLSLPEDDPIRAVVGTWVQQDGPTGPDYSIGGYTSNSVFFTNGGELWTIRRVHQQLIETTVHRVSISAKTIEVREELGTEPGQRSGIIRLRVDGKEWLVTPPSEALPLRLPYACDGDVLHLGDRVFRRVR